MLPSDTDPGFGYLLGQIQKYSGTGLPIFLVGGAVRDFLLHKPSHDLDFVLCENAQKIARRVARGLGGNFYLMDRERDISRVVCSDSRGGVLSLDFCALNGESLEQDLMGRDFTINAMAVDLSEPNRIIDPLGGKNDLKTKTLRVCEIGSIKTDPVRIVRGIRQAVEIGFSIEPATWTLMQKHAVDLSGVTAERIRDEIFRIFSVPRSATAIRLLDRLGAIDSLFPDLSSLKGVGQPLPHILDVWEHTLKALDHLDDIYASLATGEKEREKSNLTSANVVLLLGHYCSGIQAHFLTKITPGRSLRALLFLATLFHDAGKPATQTFSDKGQVHFYRHELESARLAGRIGKNLALSRLEISRMEKIIQNHMRIHNLANSHTEPTRRTVFRFFRDVEETGVEICLLALADTLATYGTTLPQDRWLEELAVCRRLLDAWFEKRQQEVYPPPLLDGNMIQQKFKLNPGPKIGMVLKAIKEAQATGEVETQAEAFVLAENLLSDLPGD